MSERVSFHTRDRRVIEGTADVERRGMASRILRGGGIALVGIGLGAASLPVPGLHFVAPPALSLLGLGIGAYVARQSVIVGTVRATCPDCGAAIEAHGGTASEDVWIRCPACTLPLRVEVLS